jgi:hypothetical protein
MANSRREFIKTSAMAVVAAGIPIELSKVVFARAGNGSAGFAAPLASLTDPLMRLKRSSFEPHLNSVFQVTTNRSTSKFNLVQVSTQSLRRQKNGKTATADRDAKSEDRFSLLFRSADALPQDVYNLNHAALGKFRILIVPVVNRDRNAYYYEAVINRTR